MNILIKNATMISMDNKREKIEENIDILIQENKILKIGNNLDNIINNETKIIDANNKIVMPGLVNTHSHVPMSIFRETIEGYNLQDWLTKKIWPMEDKLTSEDIYYASILSFIEMIRTGTTTINDMYAETQSIIKAAKQTGIRLQTTRTLMNIAREEDGEKRIKEFEKILNDPDLKDEKITFNVGIHGLYTSNTKYVEKCIEFAKKYNLKIHMHYCENEKEVKDIIQIHNMKPIEVLEKVFKGYPIILAHGVEIQKEDMQTLKNMNVDISHCPISNLKLGCGIANISGMLEKGINISLGTDGQGSGSSLDLFDTMKFTALLQKGINKDPKQLPAYEVLKMATINGAKALGLEKEIGTIEEGKKADLIILDLNNITTKPTNDLISEIIYNAKGTNVDTTIVEGNILMENRNININEQEIENQCKKIINKISK